MDIQVQHVAEIEIGVLIAEISNNAGEKKMPERKLVQLMSTVSRLPQILKLFALAICLSIDSFIKSYVNY